MLSKKVLFIATHPDDETLGCGGTILKYKDRDFEIYWLIVTCAHEKDGFPKQSIENMKSQIMKVSSSYSFSDVFTLDFPATFLDTIPLRNIIEAVSSVLKKVEPLVVYVPHIGDAHTDHRVVSQAVWSSVKTFRMPFIKEVYAYETVSETEFSNPALRTIFVPNTFCDIADYFEKKLKIMRIYKSELKSYPFPRSEENIKALATFRGATIGVKYAEAFMCLKRII